MSVDMVCVFTEPTMSPPIRLSSRQRGNWHNQQPLVKAAVCTQLGILSC